MKTIAKFTSLALLVATLTVFAVSRMETIMPGQAFSFDLDGVRVPGNSTERVASAKVLVDPTLSFEPDGIRVPGKELMASARILVDPTDSRAKRVAATLQVSDETGKVQSLIFRKAGDKPVEVPPAI